MNAKQIKFKMRFFSFVVLMVLMLSTTISGQPIESTHFPSLISSLDLDANLDFCGERVPLEIRDVRERLEKEIMLSLWDRPQVILWLKRSHRYLPHIEQTLKEGGLPDELKYVAVAESALRPHVGSKKGAIGFWQFMVETGRKYGLVINRRIDERRNIFASTRAVTRYFKDLYDAFGSWTLAAAAFNMGEDGLMAEILEQRTNDYYKLYLSLETRRYVFRILSVKMVFTHPEKYGFRLSKEDYYPPLSFDRIQLECLQETPLRIIAQASKTDFKVIKDLNPEIRGYHLAAGKYNILIPEGASEGFQARYQRHVKKFLETKKERIYVIKEGDNLSAIADRFDIPLSALLIWNRLDLRRPIHPGDRLIIYPNELKSGNIEKTE